MGRKSKEELIKIWEDTYEQSLVLPNKITTYEGTSKAYPLDRKCFISVENEDCIEVARKLSERGKTLLLNMASYKHPGGGVKRGAMAQEEEIARRSNMMLVLDEYDDGFYPMKKEDFIYLRNVTLFKDGYYNNIEPFDCDVITIAAINLNGLDKPDNYDKLMMDKILTIFYHAQLNGCRNIVLSAFGCGVFKNDPKEVATIFRNIIFNNKVYEKFDNIIFAILNDGNAEQNNYEIFKSIL